MQHSLPEDKAAPVGAKISKLRNCWLRFPFLLFVLAGLSSTYGAEAVYQTGFEGQSALQGWSSSPHARLVAGHTGAQALQIEALASVTSNVNIRVTLPLEKLRGARVKLEAMVKADHVTPPPKPYNGIKFMLNTVAPGNTQYAQQNNLFGTFDWKPVRFVTTVPPDATEARLILGLEWVHGRVWFDDIQIAVLSGPRARPARAATGPVYKGHDLPRLRGTMTGNRLSEADLRTLGSEWGANHVRWQLTWGGFPRSPADRGDLAAYDAWLESELQRLDKLLPVCREVGIKVLIDLHTPPGGRNEANECLLFHEKRFQDNFVKHWEKIAGRYRGNPTVWGFDLINEPVEGIVGESLMDWRTLAIETVRRVRKLDPDHAIIIEPGPWGNPASLYNFEPLPFPGIVYSVHMYLPHHFTHQGVHGNPVGLTYPGLIDGKMWNKNEVRRALQPAIDYQRDYGVQIYIGEFSAIRWAPDHSAFRYLKDVIDIMEENGWDWAYHAFREWNGWSVEHGPDPKDNSLSKTPTDREQLLRSWFAKNKKPR